ncbi:hypothetical protein ACWOE3_10810 [Enterococcus dispar]|uniref:Uncharacterized protein n=1 Tax=Enterococcus dispar ATCC 51266 TaxID=1139219 RepID=S1N8Y0_9ENTE|nr:hypothetical protein [Enterococcus dispar]EOT43803.1 hypothetical protein OMK_00361 [Enterococcus dispar ATCC 51266]EOW85525.1 hypothetical protein I569_00838 [Enterococcus dispar ATCC 51266]OJG37635.1 hypothetical protein RV01_GL001243 [Enterococcus dispar]
MYKPQYLNVERQEKILMAGDKVYFRKTTAVPLGYRKKPPEEKVNKSGRRFTSRS